VHSQLLPFIGAAILIALTPGADTALVVRNALVAGAAPARRTALGTASGLMVWGAASACGVAAVLNASAEAYTTVKLAGAAYLIWLGIQAIRHAGVHQPAGGARSGSPFRQGLLCNLLNPKAGVFFTALLPQFVSPQDPALAVSLLLTAIAAGTSLIWLTRLRDAGAARRRRPASPAGAPRDRSRHWDGADRPGGPPRPVEALISATSVIARAAISRAPTTAVGRWCA
jgi:threonine/homoserine/homoserine lactone efflux protein